MIRSAVKITIVLIAIGLATPVIAQSGSDFTLTLTSTFDASANQLWVDVAIDNAGGDMQGFNIDVCHDSNLLTPDAILCGPPLQALNGGMGPGLVLPYIDAYGGIV
ncbi:MAG: hypothetical protein HN598_05185, partial [Planctomycetes bacterium]|nr:hypothetical protein [Planctomycetota bacterium]